MTRAVEMKRPLLILKRIPIANRSRAIDSLDSDMPSDVLPVWFQVGVNIESVEPDHEESHVHVRFGAAAGYSWQMEAIRFLGPQADWQAAGSAFTGNDYLIEQIHESAPGDQRFYRLNGTPVKP